MRATQVRDLMPLALRWAGMAGSRVRAFELLRARYSGLARTHLQPITAAAINLHRLEDWWPELPRARTRPSTFVALAA
jgi:hypothetical protein